MSSDATHQSAGESDDVPVVGLGGSAGAIEAFQNFFSNMPADSGMAFVVVLHLSRDHESRLAEVIQQCTRMPVMQVRGTVHVQRDHVYVVKPEGHLSLCGNVLTSSNSTTTNHRRTPIDIFFRALTQEHSSRACVAILSGSGSDDAASGETGSDGTRVIAAAPAGSRTAEDEILRLREQLRTDHEQHETHSEELKAANDELQAINEELRSATEELETSREKLQAVNEELHTVSQELKAKVEDLSHAYDDMRNLMSSTDIGTVFLDRGLRLKLFTPRACDIFNFIDADVGRPLRDITNKLRGADDLIAVVEQVMARLQPAEREVQTRDGKRHLMRILLYRTSEDRIDGVVMTFLDVTALRNVESELQDSHDHAAEQMASRDRAEAALEGKSETLRRIVRAQEDERRRLARELHDEMGQHLTALKIRIESLGFTDSPEILAELRGLLTAVNDSIDRVAFELRPAALTDMGLAAALQQLVDHFRDTTGAAIDLHVKGMDGERLPEPIEVTLYRATQEALTNVARHAGARNVSVVLERTRSQVQLIVEDDGKGFDPQRVLDGRGEEARLGIVGIKERTELAAGSFDLESAPGSGTTMYVRIPVKLQDDE